MKIKINNMKSHFPIMHFSHLTPVVSNFKGHAFSSTYYFTISLAQEEDFSQ